MSLVPAAIQRCCSCGSTSVNKFTAEIALHFTGLKNIDKPVLWSFPEVPVCMDCGQAHFHITPKELQRWAYGNSYK
jgi:hypothetical protein